MMSQAIGWILRRPPLMDLLRKEPRFQAVMQELQFPQ